MNTLLKTFRVVFAIAIPAMLAVGVFAQEAAKSERGHVIALSSDGLVHGRVVAIDAPSKSFSPLSDIDVYFVQNGSVVGTVKTDAEGEFSIDGLTPGIYSFIGSGAKGFVAYGVEIEATDADAAVSEIVAPAVSPRFVALTQIVERYLPRKNSVLQPDVEIKTSFSDADDVVPGANRVFINKGTLNGTLRTAAVAEDLAGTRVFLVQNDSVVAENRADESGKFQFTGIEPGVYDFVAAGSAGFAAMGFEAVPQEPAPAPQQDDDGDDDADDDDDDKEPAKALEGVLTVPADGAVVADQVKHADELNGEVVSEESVAADSPVDLYGDAIGCGAGAGACGCECDSGYFEGGGCGGGCGGGGYYGGWSGLGEALIWGWVLTELIDDDNDNNPNPPQPISPNS